MESSAGACPIALPVTTIKNTTEVVVDLPFPLPTPFQTRHDKKLDILQTPSEHDVEKTDIHSQRLKYTTGGKQRLS